MVKKLLTEIEDSHEEVAAPAWAAVTEAAELKRELYPSEQNQTVVSGAVAKETCHALDQWITTQPFKVSRNRVIRTLVELFVSDPDLQTTVAAHLAPDELEQIIATYTDTQRAKLAALLRAENNF